MTGSGSTRLHALLVEDEFMVAMLVEGYLHDLGVERVTRSATLQDGLAQARRGDFDFAILDVRLNQDLSFPIAEVLRERGIPLTFQTGYGGEGIESRFADCPVLTKPYTLEKLREILPCLHGGRTGSADEQDAAKSSDRHSGVTSE
ncbi:hypothetical protein [Parvularcula oceani]|uniref:hypothetical protein n=1 Tax=Parvularcula oceani TaxID=1247963 RepID=UPI00192E2FD7|nr:hypothetical protein [Parvularcula oceani]